MFDIGLRPFKESDLEQLEAWRVLFQEGKLELPHGYEGTNVETAVALRGDGSTLGALTATLICALDPYIKNPNATRTELLQSLFALCRAQEYAAQRFGARESYIAVPNDLPEYQEIVKRCGFVETATNCRIYRHVFPAPDIAPSSPSE